MTNYHDGVGYLAALLVLATFCMRDMVALRAVAIASNLAFIAYGASTGLGPVLLLHLVLLPVNVQRLRESLRERQLRDQQGQGAMTRAFRRKRRPGRWHRGRGDRRHSVRTHAASGDLAAIEPRHAQLAR